MYVQIVVKSLNVINVRWRYVVNPCITRGSKIKFKKYTGLANARHITWKIHINLIILIIKEILVES